jgi:hypothetical protein
MRKRRPGHSATAFRLCLPGEPGAEAPRCIGQPIESLSVALANAKGRAAREQTPIEVWTASEASQRPAIPLWSVEPSGECNPFGKQGA